MYEQLSAEMARIKPRAPPAFKPQVLDTEKRLNILFDALNNEELKPEVVEGLGEIVKALQGKQFDAAAAGLTELQMNHESGAWMVSVTVPLLLFVCDECEADRKADWD